MPVIGGGIEVTLETLASVVLSYNRSFSLWDLSVKIDNLPLYIRITVL